MSAGPELLDFSDNLNDTRKNVKDLRLNVNDLENRVTDVKQALQYATKIENDAKEFIHTIDGMQLALKVVGRVGVLKVPADIVNRALISLENVAEQVRDKAHDINQKVVDSAFFKLLTDAEDKLVDFQDKLSGIETDLNDYQDTVDQTADVLDLVDKPLQPLSDTVDDTLAPINDTLIAINNAYDGIATDIDTFKANFSTSIFNPLVSVASAFSSITNSLAFLKGPLDAAYSALKPIEPILDAVGFIYDISVGPVVKWVLDNLGITKIFDDVSDAITGLLPKPDVLDSVFAKLDDAFGEVDKFLGTAGLNTDIAGLIDDIKADLFDVLGINADGAVRIGQNTNDTLVGRDGPDDVLNARGGDDSVQGLGGDDVLMASAGNDTLDGGAGEDRVVFRDNFSNFSFSQLGDGGPIIFTHNAAYGVKSVGTETITNVERFVFKDAQFTLSQLINNVHTATGPLLNGSNKNDFLYGGPFAVTINGRGGDDRIAGTDLADILRGGDGNDTFVGKNGADTIDGGKGNDMWLFPENNESGNSTLQVDLIAGTAWDGSDADTLSSIENITVQDSRDTELFGTNGSNVIIANGGRDWIDGRNGDDRIYGGDGRDLLIGGRGSDQVDGGGDVDYLVAGAAAGDKTSDTYDGGDGWDTLIYSSRYTNYGIRPEHSDLDNFVSQAGENPVEINVQNGLIKRLNADGSKVIGTDHAMNIERYIGSEYDDVIRGDTGGSDLEITIDGAGGNDTLYSNGSWLTAGGDGDDVVYVTLGKNEARNGTSFDGGDGFDILDTRMITNARWVIGLYGSLGSNFGGFEAKYSGGLGGDPESTSEVVGIGVGGNLKNFEKIYLGAFADEVWLEGSGLQTIYAGGGDDSIIRRFPNDGGATAFLHGQGGNDHIELSTSGKAFGEVGNDEIFVNAAGSGHVVNGGSGDDFMSIRRMDGRIVGGSGYDTVSFDVSHVPNFVSFKVDLDAKMANDVYLSNGFETSNIDAQIIGVEQLIGDDNTRDEFYGRDGKSDRFIGRGGDDYLDGRSGGDELYGGAGDDELIGGDGDDVLHGGLGNDILNGGSGIDAVSYANAAPDGARGEVTVAGFGGVTIVFAPPDIDLSLATGGFGTDTLSGIENVIGSNSDDNLTGNSLDNSFSGGAGNDMMSGEGGNDVLVLGAGDDEAHGGTGDDTIIIGAGNALISGDDGLDTLNLGSEKGTIILDLGKGKYDAQFATPVAVWADTGTTEERIFAGQALTPQLVQEADPLFTNSADDLTRLLPANDDPLQTQFAIRSIDRNVSYHGTFDGIEAVTGGAALTRIIVSSGHDTYDGSGTGKDILDLTGFNRAIVYDLAKHTSNNSKLDGDALTGIDQIAGTRLGDNLKGDEAANILYGGLGNDALTGRDGNDLIGGGKGYDTMGGGAGKDIFVYNDITESGTSGAKRDVITDFEVDTGSRSNKFVDRIDLSGIDAMMGKGGNQAFDFIGNTAFTKEGQVRAIQDGKDTLVSLNVLGNNGVDMQFKLSNFDASDLQVVDFIL